MSKPTYNEAAKIFDIVNAYLCETHLTGWEWNKAVEYIQSHWDDDEFNIDYKHELENNE